AGHRLGLGLVEAFADGTGVDLMLALAMGAVRHPHVAIALDRDGATGDALVRPGHGERLAPLAAAVGAHEDLVGVLGGVQPLEALWLLRQWSLFDAPAVIAHGVAVVGEPEGAVGSVGGRGVIVFGLPGRDLGGGRHAAHDRSASPEWSG